MTRSAMLYYAVVGGALVLCVVVGIVEWIVEWIRRRMHR